jgi:hypothetical protein
MPLPPESNASTPRARADLQLVAWASAGPLFWFCGLVLLYSLGARECQGWVPVTSWSVYGTCLLVHGLALWMLARASFAAPPEPDGRPPARVEFMRFGGIALNVLTLIVLAGFGFPLLMMGPCE